MPPGCPLPHFSDTTFSFSYFPAHPLRGPLGHSARLCSAVSVIANGWKNSAQLCQHILYAQIYHLITRWYQIYGILGKLYSLVFYLNRFKTHDTLWLVHKCRSKLTFLSRPSWVHYTWHWQWHCIEWINTHKVECLMTSSLLSTISPVHLFVTLIHLTVKLKHLIYHQVDANAFSVEAAFTTRAATASDSESSLWTRKYVGLWLYFLSD